MEMLSHGDRSRLLKIWIRGNTITLGLNVCTQRMGITYGNNITRGHIKITQNLDSQKIGSHWAWIFVSETWGLHVEIIYHVDASRLLKSWIRRKDDYTGPQPFHRENIGYMWKWYSIGKNEDYPTSGFAQNMNTRAFNIFTHDMIITYENDIPRGHIRITQNLGLQKIRLHWASIFLPRTE